jgi:hypothetical protein
MVVFVCPKLVAPEAVTWPAGQFADWLPVAVVGDGAMHCGAHVSVIVVQGVHPGLP